MEKKNEQLLALANAMVIIADKHDTQFAQWLLDHIEDAEEANASGMVINKNNDYLYSDDDYISKWEYTEMLADALTTLKYWDAIKGYTLTYDDETVIIQVRW